MSKQQTLESRIEALEIKVNALMAANTLLQAIMEQAAKMAGQALPSQPMAPPPHPLNTIRPTTPQLPEPDPSWFPVKHVWNTPDPEGKSPPACQQPAYYLIRKVGSTEPFNRDLIRRRDINEPGWHVPTLLEPSACSTCGEPVDPLTTANLDFSEAQLEPPTSLPQATQLRSPRRRADRRRPGSAPDTVRVAADYTQAPSGFSSPGPEGETADQEPSLPAMIGPMTPEATREAVDAVTALARQMGMGDDR